MVCPGRTAMFLKRPRRGAESTVLSDLSEAAVASWTQVKPSRQVLLT
jgi:hypothetical protein